MIFMTSQYVCRTIHSRLCQSLPSKLYGWVYWSVLKCHLSYENKINCIRRNRFEPFFQSLMRQAIREVLILSLPWPANWFGSVKRSNLRSAGHYKSLSNSGWRKWVICSDMSAPVFPIASRRLVSRYSPFIVWDSSMNDSIALPSNCSWISSSLFFRVDVT